MTRTPILRAAARKSLKVDLPNMVRQASGTRVRNQLETLRARRYSVPDTTFAYAYRAVLGNRQATRQSVQDRMCGIRLVKPKRPYRGRVERNRLRFRAWDPNNCNSSTYLDEPERCGQFYDN